MSNIDCFNANTNPNAFGVLRGTFFLVVAICWCILETRPLPAQTSLPARRDAADYFVPRGRIDRFLPQSRRNSLPTMYERNSGDAPMILLAPVEQPFSHSEFSRSESLGSADAFYNYYSRRFNRPAPRASSSLSAPSITRPRHHLAEITNLPGSLSSSLPPIASEDSTKTEHFDANAAPAAQWFRAPRRRSGTSDAIAGAVLNAAATTRSVSSVPDRSESVAETNGLEASRPVRAGAFDPRIITQTIANSRLSRSAPPVFMYDDPQRLQAMREAERLEALQAFEKSLESLVLQETRVVMLSPVEVKYQNGTATVRGIVADESSRVLTTQTLLKSPRVEHVDNQMTVYQP